MNYKLKKETKNCISTDTHTHTKHKDKLAKGNTNLGSDGASGLSATHRLDKNHPMISVLSNISTFTLLHAKCIQSGDLSAS